MKNSTQNTNIKYFYGLVTLVTIMNVSNLNTTTDYSIPKNLNYKYITQSLNDAQTLNYNYSQNEELQNFKTMVDFANHIIENSVSIDSEIAQIIDDNFMDLLA
jgi:hypothetical protein